MLKITMLKEKPNSENEFTTQTMNLSKGDTVRICITGSMTSHPKIKICKESFDVTNIMIVEATV